MSRFEKIETIKLKLYIFRVRQDFKESRFNFLLRMHVIEFTGSWIHYLLMMRDSGKELRIIID